MNNPTMGEDLLDAWGIPKSSIKSITINMTPGGDTVTIERYLLDEEERLTMMTVVDNYLLVAESA